MWCVFPTRNIFHILGPTDEMEERERDQGRLQLEPWPVSLVTWPTMTLFTYSLTTRNLLFHFPTNSICSCFSGKLPHESCFPFSTLIYPSGVVHQLPLLGFLFQHNCSVTRTHIPVINAFLFFFIFVFYYSFINNRQAEVASAQNINSTHARSQEVAGWDKPLNTLF